MTWAHHRPKVWLALGEPVRVANAPLPGLASSPPVHDVANNLPSLPPPTNVASPTFRLAAGRRAGSPTGPTWQEQLSPHITGDAR
eukprot:9490138-Pyramimonas_sp.AAC.1